MTREQQLEAALRELRDAEAALAQAKVDAARAQGAIRDVSDEDGDELFTEKIRVRDEMFDTQISCAERLLAARERADAALAAGQPVPSDTESES